MNKSLFLKLTRYYLHFLFLGVCLLTVGQANAQSQQTTTPYIKDVTFKTEDGWVIHGTYYIPHRVGEAPAPGLVVLSEPDNNPRYLGGNISRSVQEIGIAALAIDVRGSTDSFGEKDFEMFNQEERDALQLDIRAAIKWLSSQKEVDSDRIGIFGATLTADYVAREAARNLTQVKAVVLSTGWLTDKGREALTYRKDLPVLAIVSHDEPREKQEMAAEPFFVSRDRESRLIFVVDRGAAIFNRPGHPMERVTAWLKQNLLALGTKTVVSFKTEDGVTLQGTLYMPDGIDENETVPGVAYFHGANHDATTYYELAQEVTKTGIASLIFDQRGYMKSVYKARSSSRDHETMQKDMKAAINFLASQASVDSNRIGVVTATSRSAPAVIAVHDDPRVKTLVGMSFYGGTPESNRAISSMDIPMFLIASINDENADGSSLDTGTREAYRLSNNKETELLMYDGGGRGTSMMRIKPELVGMTVRWFNEKLNK